MFFMKWSDDGRLEFTRKNGFRDGKIDESCYWRRKESRHDFRRSVGIRSREQVASEEDSMAVRTSSIVAGEKVEREGGGEGGGRWGEIREAGKERRVERSFAILSPKKLRKEVARREGEGVVGKEEMFYAKGESQDRPIVF